VTVTMTMTATQPDSTASAIVWLVVVAVAAIGVACAAVAFWMPRSFRRARATASGLTVAAAVALFAGVVLASLPLSAPGAVVHVIVGVLALALATIGGGPVAILALRLATRGAPSTAGPNGGILVNPNPAPPASAAPGTDPAAAAATATATGEQEVLRGGTTIGLLERIAVAGSVIAGFPEGIAVVVAVKGVGRFTELSTPEAKERFIIGTLASFVWACACTALVK
jgi:hypothetical protein